MASNQQFGNTPTPHHMVNMEVLVDFNLPFDQQRLEAFNAVVHFMFANDSNMVSNLVIADRF